jgi:hypothetical protein
VRSRRDLEAKKLELAKELAQVRKMIDEQGAEIKERRKELMRQETDQREYL